MKLKFGGSLNTMLMKYRKDTIDKKTIILLEAAQDLFEVKACMNLKTGRIT